MQIFLLENHKTFTSQAQAILRENGIQTRACVEVDDILSAIQLVSTPSLLLEVTGQQFNTRDVLTVLRAPVPIHELVRPLVFRFSWGNAYRVPQDLRFPEQLKDWFVSSEKPLHPDVTFYYLGSRFNYMSRAWRFPVVQVNPSPNGIFAAHRMLAAMCPTKAFAVVDEDNWITDVPVLPEVIRHTVIYHALNPYNGLIYGHGGLKIFLRSSFRECIGIPQNVDMTEAVSNELTVVPQVCSEHRFATTTYQAWRGAFREVIKLLRTADTQSTDRLRVWLTAQGVFPLQQAMHKGALDALRLGDFPINNESELHKLYLGAQK